MAYRNVKTQCKALNVTIERMSNGFTVTPEYEGESYSTKRAEHAVICETIALAQKEMARMFEKGTSVEEEKWVD